MKTIAILGSTGSIGTQTLEVVRENQDIRVAALAAGNNIALLEQQIREFAPKTVAVWTEEKAKELQERVKVLPVKIVSGMDGLLEISVLEETDILVTAIVGMIGIRPTIAAIRAGKDSPAGGTALAEDRFDSGRFANAGKSSGIGPVFE